MKEVYIIGSAPSSRDLVDYNRADCEFWTLAQRHEKKSTRVFEIHDKEAFPDSFSDDVIEMQNKKYPNNPIFYTIEPDSRFNNNQVYPIKEAQDLLIKHGCTDTFLMSSIAYMLVLAILDGFEVINLYGIDMKAGDEYSYQRSNMEFLIGLAIGKGIVVNIPRQSCLLKSAWRYGTKESKAAMLDDGGDLSLSNLKERLEKHEALKARISKQLDILSGYKIMADKLKSHCIDGKLDESIIDKAITETVKSYEANNLNGLQLEGTIAECKVVIDLARNKALGGV